MNHIFRLVWSQANNAWVAVAETTRGRGKSSSRKLVAAALSLTAIAAQAGPTGGQVTAGAGQITQSGATTTVSQSSQNLSLNWSTFNIASQETVNFVQPSSSAIAVNRILDTNGSQIFGHLNANGQVFLINPNGILFGAGAQVNVGGLVASTLATGDGGGTSRSFSGSGTGSVINQGTITANGNGYVALLGNHVANQGTISAQLGTVALAAGNAVTLSFSGNSMVQVQVDQSVLNSLAENGGLIRADGGQVVMTAGAKDALLASAVNNTGVIEAHTVDNHGGTITLLGGMAGGTVNVGGTLDASAPNGGNGGFIETSAAHVKVADSASVSTAAVQGKAGTWLIDPADFLVAPIDGDMSGSALNAALLAGDVTISSATGASGTQGNVDIDAAVSWSSHKLTLNATNDVNVNAVMAATGAASLDMEPSSGNVNVALGNSGFNGRVDFSGSGTLTMNGHVYTVINSLGTATSSGDGTLQGTVGNLGGYYALGSNINAASTSGWNSGAGFTSIGGGSSTTLTAPEEFSGVFDGLGHTVNNLTINVGNVNGVGLIGAIASTGVVRNVGLSGGSVAVTGANYAGTLVGQNFGTLNNSYSSATISATAHANYVGGLVGQTNGGTVAQSYATGAVDGGSNASNVGGLVGGMQGGTVSFSHATGNVTGSSNYVGGLVGYMYGGTGLNALVTNSYATGAVSGATYVGGLVGSSYGFKGSSTITKSYATGSVSGTTAVGGLVGHSYGGGTYGGTSTVDNSYATGSVTGAAGATYVGGLIGNNYGLGSDGTVTNSFSAGAVSAGAGSTFVGGLIGNNNTGAVTGSFWDTTTSGQPTSAGGTGMTTGQMQTQLNFSSGTSANGNVNPAWDFSSIWVMFGGYPVLLADMSRLTIKANNATATYNGSAYASNNGVTYTDTSNGYQYSGVPSGVSGSLSYGGTSQAAVDVGTYTIIPSGQVSSGQQGFVISYANGVLTINPLALTASLSAGSSVYGAALTPGSVTFTNLVSGDNVTAGTVTVNTSGLTSTSGHLTAGTHVGIESVGTTLGGTSAGNYTFAGATGDYTVTPLALTGSVATGTTTYGAALVPGAASFTNAVSGDLLGTVTVSVNTTGLTSTSGHLVAGTHSGIESVTALSGADAGNYTFSGITGDYTVNQLALNATIATGSSTYGSALAPGALSFTNLVSGDAVSGSAVTVNTSGLTSTSGNLTAGTHNGIESVTSALSGADAGNYTFAGATGNYTVAPLALTGSIAAGSSTYGATLAPGAASLTGAISGDVIGTATVTVNTSGLTSTSGHLIAGTHTGIESVTALSGADGGNYTFTGITGDYTVNTLALTGSLATGNSVYGASLAPGSATFTNIVSGDDVSAGAVTVNTTGLTSTSGNLIAGTHVGIQSVTGLTGADAANYTFAGLTGDYTVTQLALNAAIATGSTTYGSALVPGAFSFTNLVSGDVVTTGAVTVNTAGLTSTSGNLTAGTHNGIQSVAAALGGADAANYTFTGATGNYTVTPLALSGSIAAGSSTYGATLAPGAASLSGAISGDVLGTATVTVNTSGLTSTSGHLIAGTHVGIESVSALSGADGGNYSFAGVTGDYTVNTLALTGSLTTGSSTYGASLAPGVASFTNLVSGDVVSAGAVTVNTTGLTSTSGNLVAGTHNGIESVGSSLSGADAANYTFAGATGNYTVAPLALTGSVTTGTSTYGSAYAPGSAGFANVVSGDVVSASGVTIATTGQTSTSGHLTAGSHSGVESVAGLAGADAGNYTFAGITGNYSVSQLALTGSIATGTSTYGASLAPGAASLSGAVSGDVLGTATVSVNTTGLTSSSGHLTAGTHTGIETVSSLSGVDGANYTFAAVTGDYTVNPLALNATVAAGSSTYGAALAPGAANFTNVVSGDVVTPGAVTVNTTGLTSTSGNLTAGTHTGIESVGTTLGGTDAANYSFAGATGDYSVAKLALTGSVAAGTSTYGAALAPGAASLSGAIGGDVLGTATVTVNTTGLTSTSGHLVAGTHTGIEGVSALSGVDGGNYTFAGITGDYSVSKLALTGAVATGTSTYGSPLAPGVANFTNLVAGDVVTTPVATVNTTGQTSTSGNLTAGTHTGIESVGTTLSGTDAGNYTFAGATGNYTVAPLALNGSISASSSTYGAPLVPGSVSLGNVVAGDSVTAPGATVNTTGLTSSSGNLIAGTHVGIQTVSGSIGGADAANYTFGAITGDYTVNKLAVTLTATGTNKVYDATLTDAVTVTASGVIAGDAITFGTASGNFADKNVGNGKTVTVSGVNVSGADAGNYDVSIGSLTTTANITPLPITVTAVGANKTYDGTTTAVVSLSGGLAGDNVAFSDTAANFTDKNVGNGKTINVTGISASGADAGNYTVSGTTTATANITPATLTYVATPASIVAGQSLSGLTGTVNGFVSGDSIGNSTTGTLVWTSTAGATSLPGLYEIDGTGLGATNYVFVQAPGNAAALTLKPGSAPVSVSNLVTAFDSIFAPTHQGLDLASLGLVPFNVKVNAGYSQAIGDGSRGLALQVINGGVKLPDNIVNVNE
jgi:filamentous hemagglutinin family protein